MRFTGVILEHNTCLGICWTSFQTGPVCHSHLDLDPQLHSQPQDVVPLCCQRQVRSGKKIPTATATPFGKLTKIWKESNLLDPWHSLSIFTVSHHHHHHHHHHRHHLHHHHYLRSGWLSGSSTISSTFHASALVPPYHHHHSNYHIPRPTFSCSSRRFYGEDEDAVNYGFREAVFLFNQREYYKCHDYLEHLWVRAEDPLRTLFHGILQCAVGFHHLFNRNHKGAMMELGEGLCKLRKMNFQDGPFHQFEREISAALDFVNETQIELAACAEDLCIAMDGSERSYQLLGGYGAGENLYHLQTDADNVTYIVFRLERYEEGRGPELRTKLPALYATEEHLQHRT